jgi:hypothetical protein
MIQLANDPNASRTGWRPAAAQGGKDHPIDAKRPRAHAWPFLSREVDRDPSRSPGKESNSPSRAENGS